MLYHASPLKFKHPICMDEPRDGANNSALGIWEK